MNKFKPGDRIAVYTVAGTKLKRITGTVTHVYTDCPSIEFQHDNSALIDVAWPEQCRRLKPKAKREPLTIWVNRVCSGTNIDYMYGQTNWSKEAAAAEGQKTYISGQKVTTMLMREVIRKKARP